MNARRRVKTGHRLMLTAAALVVVCFACAVERTERIEVGGKTYGETAGSFRGKWWNYFERGMSYTEAAVEADKAGDTAAKRKALQLAQADLETAISMRDKDQRRARTYGMHLIDYFPHRELGIVFYLQGRYADAVRELEASLSSVESAKAQFYLDKARKALIEQEGGDNTPPRIFVDSLPSLVNSPSIEISFTVEDDQFAAYAAVGGEELLIPLAEKRLALKKEVLLNEGENRIEITAGDLAGNESRETVRITLDSTGPEVVVEESVPAPGIPDKLRVKGKVNDASGVEAIKIGEWEFALGEDGGFDVTVPVGESGAIPFKVIDGAGNETSGEFGRGGTTLEQGRIGGVRSAFALPFGVSDWLPCGWWFHSGAEVVQSSTPSVPVIEIKGLTGKQTVYLKSFYVEGWVSDPSGVQSLVVGSRSLISQPGKKVYFNYLTQLKSGPNKLTFVAKNMRGLASQKVIEVDVEVPQVKQVGSRMSVSMLPFHLRGKRDLSQVAYDDLLKAITASGRFNLVDRRVIDKVVRELKLSEAKLTDQTITVKAGKLTQAEAVLIGFVYETSYSIEVYARVVDVETSTILAEKDAYLEGSPISLKDLMKLMEGLTIKINNQFPLVEGQVLGLEGKTLTAQLTAKASLPQGAKFIIFKEQPVFHPQTKRHLGNQTIPLAEARITDARGGQVAAVLVNPKDSGKITKNSKVITK